MVCTYCGSFTSVSNSRLQRRDNHIWRRRNCSACGSLFTTIERPDLEAAYMVDGRNGLEAFSRDKLFITIHRSCEHRPTAVSDAGGLTQTIIAQVLDLQDGGILRRDDIVRTSQLALRRFDQAAATSYAAYHPLSA